MASQKYRHGKLLLEGQPLQEITEITWDEENNSQWVETKDPGLLKSNIPPKVNITFNTQIPRGGMEYAYKTAMRSGAQVLIQLSDVDGVDSARVRISKISKSDRFASDRSCTISCDGYVVA